MANLFIGPDYFSVSFTFFSQPKVRKLARITEGIGPEVYLAAIAIMISTEAPVDADGIDTIAMDLSLETDDVRFALDTCSTLKLLESSSDYNGETVFTSPDVEEAFDERIRYIEQKRRAGSAGGKAKALKAIPIPERGVKSSTC